MVREACIASAPTGIANGSMTMSSMGIPYFVVAYVHDLAYELDPTLWVLRNLVLVVRQRDDGGVVLLDQGKDQFHPLVLGGDRVDQGFALVRREAGFQRLDDGRVDTQRQIGQALN